MAKDLDQQLEPSRIKKLQDDYYRSQSNAENIREDNRPKANKHASARINP